MTGLIEMGKARRVAMEKRAKRAERLRRRLFTTLKHMGVSGVETQLDWGSDYYLTVVFCDVVAQAYADREEEKIRREFGGGSTGEAGRT